MKRNLKIFSICGIFFFIIYFILTNSSIVINSVLNSLELWKNVLFPSLFPFFLLAELLIYFGFVDFLGELLKKVTSFFRVNKNSAFVLVMSMISGFPSGARSMKSLYDKDKISSNDIKQLLYFTHFANPLFIIGGIGYLLLNDITIGIYIMISHYVANFILGFIFRKRKVILKEKISIRRALGYLDKEKSNSFISTLSSAITSSIQTLLLLLGIIIFFGIISEIIKNTISLPDTFNLIISGILEITNGINLVSFSSLSLEVKGLIISCFLSFGGLSVHMQVLSILRGSNIKYSDYFKARLLHLFIAFLLYILILLVR